MAASRFCLLFLCATLVLIPIDCYKNDHVALFIFGDSFFDAGNNAKLNNSLVLTLNPPYGKSFFEQPTGRASDGRLIPDFIAEYANLPLIPPYLQFINSHKSIIKENLGLGESGRVLQEMVIDFKIPRKFLEYSSNHPFENGVNFATGGAGALSETRENNTISLKGQLEYFTDVEKQLRLELGDAEANKLLSKAVYMFSKGSNDYFVAVSDATVLEHYTREEYVGMVIGNLTTAIQEIYKKGGRKFGFSTLQPIGCFPIFRAINLIFKVKIGCLEEANLLIELHNRALPEALKELEGQLEGFKYSIFDGYKAGTERINNPSNYGFENVTAACCGGGLYRGVLPCGLDGFFKLCDNVKEYMFFDSAHHTESANNQFAKLMWDGGADYTSPVNLKSLFEE